MIDQWIKEIKKECPANMLGMILLHNGIMRATAKDGGKVEAINVVRFIVHS
jgi:molybdopterin synthase catalytic subunit